MNLIVKNQHT